MTEFSDMHWRRSTLAARLGSAKFTSSEMRLPVRRIYGAEVQRSGFEKSRESHA
jgi:hypothetical protein